jgi:hypothetical protein
MADEGHSEIGRRGQPLSERGNENDDEHPHGQTTEGGPPKDINRRNLLLSGGALLAVDMQPLEAVAASSLIALLGGLLMPPALFISLDRGLLVWIVVVASGVVLGASVSASVKSTLKTVILPSAVFPITITGYLVVRWLFSWIQHPDTSRVYIPLGSGAIVDPFPVMVGLFALMVIGIVSSYIAIVLAAMAARPLLSAATHLYRFGPDGLIAVRKIIVATVSVIAAIILLWGAFSARSIY